MSLMNPASLKALLDGDIENAIVASTPGGIRQQEAQAQKDLVNSEKFPIECNHANGLKTCPKEHCFNGEQKMLDGELYTGYTLDLTDEEQKRLEYETCEGCGGTTLHPDALEKLEELGIIFVEKIDDLFVKAELPEGWTKEPLDHSMWSDILDGDGSKRGSIFYKGAFYDRQAHFSLNSRFGVRNIYEESNDELGLEPADAEVRQKVIVFDEKQNEILFENDSWIEPRDWDTQEEISKEMKEKIENLVPNWNHCLKSWEVEL